MKDRWDAALGLILVDARFRLAGAAIIVALIWAGFLWATAVRGA